MNTPSAENASQEAARLKAIYNDRKRSNRALNQAVLAEMCGWSSQGTVSQYMNGGLELNLEALLKFAAALAFDPAEVSPRLTGLISRATTADASPLKEAELTPGVALPSQAFRRAPIKGIAQLGPDGYWDALETSDGWIDIPTSDPQAYSLRVKGDSMAPAIRNGWAVWCEPNHQLVPGEYVMVRRTNGQCMVKELLFENTEAVSLMSINPSYGRLTIPREEIEQIHYVGGIVPASKIRY